MIDKKEEDIINNWKNFDINQPMVSIRTITYNHAAYIAQALDSFLMQKTTFPFEIIIHDDASTDGTTNIIREYEKKFPKIIKPLYEEKNQWSQRKSFTKIVNDACSGKYIALCEGDDYWCDENKLQRQFDFMENNPEYSICLTNGYKYNQLTKEQLLMNTFDKEGEISVRDNIISGLLKDFPATASYFYRNDLLKKMHKSFYGYAAGDYCTRLYFASKGKCYYFEKPMAVYRINNQSSYMGKIDKVKKEYFAHIFSMLKLWKMLDTYFQFEYSDLFQPKINDAYWGLCLTYKWYYASKKGLEKMSLGETNTIFKLISKSCLPEGIKDFCKTVEKVYIFGTSYLSKRCAVQMKRAKIRFEGFVISDGYPKGKKMKIKGKKIYYVSEIELSEKTGVIIACQPKNTEIISYDLSKKGFNKIYKPYLT